MTSAAADDELLAGFLDDLVERQRRGDTIQIEQVIQERPHWAAELRDLWATIQVAEILGGNESGSIADSVSLLPGATTGRSSTTASRLPRRFGHYELLEELGRGGMGIVYRAQDLKLGRTVALKMILRGEMATAEDFRRFRTEAEATARLDHPQIVPVYEVGEIDDAPYFSMKYVPGTTLARRLVEGPLSARETAQLLEPICRAIDMAHQRGVLHRDLKPSNILLDTDGQPHVSDFGLAKRFSPSDISQLALEGHSTGSGGERIPESVAGMTHTGAILGTPAYMAPEQAAGRRGIVGPVSDVYSLGSLLYHCLTGRAPFQARSPVDVLLMVLEQDPPLPRVINPKVDPDLEMIALKCLQKPQDLRYPSAGALADDLHRWLVHEPISARSTSLGQLVSRMLRETHHAGVLENWGLLWMWHSLVLVVVCGLTNAFQWWGIADRLPYLGLWIVGFGTWSAIFWMLRRRSGPITFVERQVAHVWGASMVASNLLFWIEVVLDLPVLTLSPVLPLIAGMVFFIKAGILTGAFYIQALVLFSTSLAMAEIRHYHFPDFGLLLYGVASALCFFVPGLKYYRQRRALSR